MSARVVPCPVCVHDETMVARRNGYEASYDDVPSMRWCPPYRGPQGQVFTRLGRGSWQCERCGFEATPHETGTLLDAVLNHSHPDCDSIRDGIHEGTWNAFDGGDRRSNDGKA